MNHKSPQHWMANTDAFKKSAKIPSPYIEKRVQTEQSPRARILEFNKQAQKFTGYKWKKFGGKSKSRKSRRTRRIRRTRKRL